MYTSYIQDDTTACVSRAILLCTHEHQAEEHPSTEITLCLSEPDFLSYKDERRGILLPVGVGVLTSLTDGLLEVSENVSSTCSGL